MQTKRDELKQALTNQTASIIAVKGLNTGIQLIAKCDPGAHDHRWIMTTMVPESIAMRTIEWVASKYPQAKLMVACQLPYVGERV